MAVGLLLSAAVAGLMFGACGAPDEVVRYASLAHAGGSAGGSSSSSSAAGGAAGSTAQPSGGVSSQGGTKDSGGTVGTGGRSSTGGTVGKGGTTATGGQSTTGGTTATGGRGGGGATGGTSATGGRGGIGGAGGTNPFASGGSSKGGAGGGAGVTTGGSSGRGGVDGGGGGAGGSTSTAPPPTGSLAVYVTQKVAGSTNGQISLDFRIDNQTSASVDLSNVTLRYWYQDEGWVTTNLTLEVDYKSLSSDNVTGGKAVAAPSPTAGADHYLELSFSGTVAAKGAASGADQFATNIRLHNNWVGTVDVTNDYSYNAGATGYNSKITLYGNGKLISGTEP